MRDTAKVDRQRYEIELRGRYVEELERLAAEHLYDDVEAYAAVVLRNALWASAEKFERSVALKR